MNLAPLSAPAALGEGGGVPAPQPVAAPAATPTQLTTPLDLAEPDTTLPETVSSADASSVAAPQGQEASFDTPIEDANEVSAPNQANAPQVGASPSSGPIDVAAPSDLTPSLPTPVTGGAEPITSAAPPIGWEDTEEEVEVFDTDSSTTPLTCAAGIGCIAKDIYHQNSNLLNGMREVIGDREDALYEYKSNLDNLHNMVSTKLDLRAADMLRTMLDVYGDNEDSKALLPDINGVLLNIATGVDVGNITKADIQEAYDAWQEGEFIEGSLVPVCVVCFGGSNNLPQNVALAVAVSELEARSMGYASSLEQTSEANFGNPQAIATMALLVQFGLDVAGGGRKRPRTGAVRQTARMRRMLRNGITSPQMRQRFKNARPKIRAVMGCGGHSFSAETLVATATGAVAIETLVDREGIEVTSYNEETGRVESNVITAVHVHDDPVIINLTVDPDLSDNQPGELIETTPEHPFYADGTWVNAGDLTAGDTVVSFDGDKGILANGTVTSVERVAEPQMMYNLTVDEAHTFFVGEGEWLVHNTNLKCSFQKLAGVVSDANKKGFHLDSISGEIRLNTTSEWSSSY